MRSVVEYLYDHAKHTPDKFCIADESESLTYADYWERICRTAAVLRGHGVTEGSCMVIVCAQDITYLASELALHLLHAVFVPLERSCGERRIASIAAETDAVLVVCDQAVEGMEVLTYEQLREEIRLAPYREMTDFPDSGMISEILFSTGTTGKPKGIVLDHRSSVALAENVICGVEMKPDTVEMIPTPLNHSHGLRRYYGNMVNGSSVVVLNGVLNISRFFQYLERFRVSAIDLVPTMLSVILRLSKDKLHDYRDQLDYVQLGGAHLPEEEKETLCRLLPGSRLYNFYGSTESGCSSILDFNDGVRRDNCIGRPAVNAEFVTVDETGRPFDATRETPGLLASSGPMNMIGYYHDPEETAKVLADGYIRTSDIAYIEDGYIYLMGRKGDVMNVAGNKVSPQEIEETAMRYPGVIDCACVPAPDRMKGTVPKLFIVRDPKIPVTTEELRVYLSGNLEAYKVPKTISEIERIPRTFNGKILRKELMGK